MTLRKFAATAAVLLSLTAVPALHASTDGKVKTVNVHVQNRTKAAVTIQAGEKQLVIAAGKEGAIRVPDGTELVTVNSTPTRAAGAVVATANKSLNGTSVIVE